MRICTCECIFKTPAVHKVVRQGVCVQQAALRRYGFHQGLLWICVCKTRVAASPHSAGIYAGTTTLGAFKTRWEASVDPILEVSWQWNDKMNSGISVSSVTHRQEMRVQGIYPICGKLKFRGAKDTETFFMHKSISVWLSETHHTCRLCLNACCQGARRLHFAWFTHSTLVMQILSLSLLPCLSGSSALAALDVPTTGPRHINGSQV